MKLTRQKLNILAAVFFIGLGLAAYRSILSGYPVADDFGHITKISGLHFYDIWGFFTLQSRYFIRPIPFYAIWLQYSIFGLNWFPDHLLNVVMHALNAGLLFLLLSRLGANRLGAFAAATLVVLSPLAPEAVTWTAGRFDVWAIFFMLIALLSYAAYLEKRRRALIGVALAATAAALLSKETAVMLIVLIPAMDLLFGDILRKAPGAKAKPVLNRAGIFTWEGIYGFGARMLPFFAIFSGYFVLRLAISGTLARMPSYMSTSDSAGFNLHAPMRTLLTLAAPLDRVEVSSRQIIILGMYFGILLLASLLLVATRWKRSTPLARRTWLFMAIFFIAAIMPAYSSFFFTGMSNYLNNSRFFYCTIFATAPLLTIGLFDFGWKAKGWRWGLGVLLAVMAVAYTWGLATNNTVWVNASTISYYINNETKSLLPDPPRGASLYFENVPKLEGGHIYASALDDAISLSYGRDDINVFYVDPDPAIARLFTTNPDSRNGFLFDYDWNTGKLILVRGPLAGN
ncbi:MAG: glycosyltransferase family 39 protein [Actinobacteria bacterium]|nr:glycosyltransferase family 39 protein [Actinomycetota bacterium]